MSGNLLGKMYVDIVTSFALLSLEMNKQVYLNLSELYFLLSESHLKETTSEKRQNMIKQHQWPHS